AMSQQVGERRGQARAVVGLLVAEIVRREQNARRVVDPFGGRAAQEGIGFYHLVEHLGLGGHDGWPILWGACAGRLARSPAARCRALSRGSGCGDRSSRGWAWAPELEQEPAR